jgi:hypothetical protein
LRKAQRGFEQVGKSMTQMGARLSVAVTAPIVAIGVKSFKAAIQSREAFAQVEQALKTMGDASGKTAAQLKKSAAQLQRFSNFDDDDILKKVTANLLTFGNVSGDVFDRAQQAAVDLSARLGQDLQSSAIQLGKALNDPLKGLTALSRVGVSFTADQQAMVKSMVAAGDAAGAQKLILAELEKQYGGAAKAAREAAPGGDLAERWRTFQEVVGERLVQAFEKLERAITPILDAFLNMSPAAQTVSVALAAIAAAVGPLLVIMGFAVQGMAPFLAVMSTLAAKGGVLVAAKAGLVGLAAAFGPVLIPAAAIAAAGYLIYQNWDKIAPVLKEFAAELQKAIGPEMGELIRQIGGALRDLWAVIGPPIRTAVQSFGLLYAAWVRTFGPVVIGAIKVVIGALAAFIKVVRDLPGFAINALKALYEGVSTWFGDKLNALWNIGIANIEKVKKAFFFLYDAVVGNSYIPDMVDGIAAQMARLDAVMVNPARKATEKAADAFKKLAEDVAPVLDRLFPEAAAANRFRSDRGAIDRAVKGGVLTADQGSEAQRRLAVEGKGNGLQGFLAGSENPLGIDDAKKAFDRFVDASQSAAAKAQAANVRIVKSFKDMANDTISALQQVTNAVKGGGFLNILSSVIGLGLQLGGIGAFGKKIQTNVNRVPAYAGGTKFHPGGMALVGERGPELVNLPRGSQVIPNGAGGSRIEVVPSPFFNVVVDGRIMRAAPAIAEAGGSVGAARMAQSDAWRLR